MGIPLKDGALAFALTLGAGMFTCLGASVVFFPSLVKFANKQFLASSLAVAAGVMIYVSFVEIFQKSLVGLSVLFAHGRGKQSHIKMIISSPLRSSPLKTLATPTAWHIR